MRLDWIRHEIRSLIEQYDLMTTCAKQISFLSSTYNCRFKSPDTMKCKKIILKRMFDGYPKISDFETVIEDVNEELQDGEFLYGSLAVSVDPYIRSFVGVIYHEGDTVIGTVLVRIKESKSSRYKTGMMVVLQCGWRDGGKAKESDVWTVRNDMPKNVPLSSALGMYGVAGMAAYIAMIYVCKVKEKETVFISGAAGGVGNVAVQIAKSKGCRVVGSCGTDEKVAFCKKIGYDDAFNYKTEAKNLSAAIERVAPEGIDCYLDNVGGSFAHEVFKHMKNNGRVATSGSISRFAEKNDATAPNLQPLISSKALTVQGFATFKSQEKYGEIYYALKAWTEEGKLKCYETVTNGFENIPEAFVGMMGGANIGKAVVRL